jgi:(2Fe-2S) ferredoxin
MSRLNSYRELEHLREGLRERLEKYRATVMLCGGPGCHTSRSKDVKEAIEKELKAQGLTSKVRLMVTGCHGFCEEGPLMVIEPGNLLYCRISPDDAYEIVSQTLIGDKAIERLLYLDPATGKRVRTMNEVPFYKAQDQRLLAQNRLVDSCSIEDYIAAGGYTALAKVLKGVAPLDVIKEIKAAGLRGRGGGGFPTGRKWTECQEAPGDEKYVICNADEGDPGAYMDRGVLEGNPHLVLEGMMIGARAVGAGKGYIYVRQAGTRARTPRREHTGLFFLVRCGYRQGRRGFCLRRINRPHGFRRRQSR